MFLSETNQAKQTIRTFVRFNNRTFECGKYTFVPALNLTKQHLRPPVLAILLETIEREIFTDY